MGKENFEMAKSLFNKASPLDCRGISEGAFQCEEQNHKPVQSLV